MLRPQSIEGMGKKYGGGAAAQPDADGGTACLAIFARTGAPHGAAPPHSVTIQACPYIDKSYLRSPKVVSAELLANRFGFSPDMGAMPTESVGLPRSRKLISGTDQQSERDRHSAGLYVFGFAAYRA